MTEYKNGFREICGGKIISPNGIDCVKVNVEGMVSGEAARATNAIIRALDKEFIGNEDVLPDSDEHHYANFVLRKLKPGEGIEKIHTIHGFNRMIGVLAASRHLGDVADSVKKKHIYGKDLDDSHEDNLSEAFEAGLKESRFLQGIDLKPNASLYSLLHVVIGLIGEVSEVASEVLDSIIECREMDCDNLREEAGDIAFYLQAFINEIGTTPQIIRAENVAKLDKRYKKGYTDAEAAGRADKAPAPGAETR